MMTDESERLERLFRRAYEDAPEPPPYFEESLEEMAALRATVSSIEADAIKEGVRGGLFAKPSFGALVRKRREGARAELEVVAAVAGWAEDDLEKLESDLLDLAVTPPEDVARVLRVLRLSLRSVKDALQTLAWRHLAVQRGATGPVFGRTRRDVSSFERRTDLSRGIGEIDRAATERAVAEYLHEIEEALEEDPR